MNYTSMTTEERFKELKFLIQAIQDSVDIKKDHPDPLSVHDCWLYMREILEDLEEEFKENEP